MKFLQGTFLIYGHQRDAVYGFLTYETNLISGLCVIGGAAVIVQPTFFTILYSFIRLKLKFTEKTEKFDLLQNENMMEENDKNSMIDKTSYTVKLFKLYR